jgi:hypothetical protein
LSLRADERAYILELTTLEFGELLDCCTMSSEHEPVLPLRNEPTGSMSDIYRHVELQFD